MIGTKCDNFYEKNLCKSNNNNLYGAKIIEKVLESTETK